VFRDRVRVPKAAQATAVLWPVLMCTVTCAVRAIVTAATSIPSSLTHRALLLVLLARARAVGAGAGAGAGAGVAGAGAGRAGGG